MNYTGIDHHKRYSLACTLDERGRLLKQARIDHNAPGGLRRLLRGARRPERSGDRGVLELGHPLRPVGRDAECRQSVLSNPAKNRIIADAQIKNDEVDAKALATLLRGNFVSIVHVPGKDVRQKKNTVRQRLWLARVRTMVGNRIHTVLDRQTRHPESARN